MFTTRYIVQRYENLTRDWVDVEIAVGEKVDRALRRLNDKNSEAKVSGHLYRLKPVSAQLWLNDTWLPYNPLIGSSLEVALKNQGSENYIRYEGRYYRNSPEDNPLNVDYDLQINVGDTNEQWVDSNLNILKGDPLDTLLSSVDFFESVQYKNAFYRKVHLENNMNKVYKVINSEPKDQKASDIQAISRKVQTNFQYLMVKTGSDIKMQDHGSTEGVVMCLDICKALGVNPDDPIAGATNR